MYFAGARNRMETALRFRGVPDDEEEEDDEEEPADREEDEEDESGYSE